MVLPVLYTGVIALANYSNISSHSIILHGKLLSKHSVGPVFDLLNESFREILKERI
jgi:hypothetical protein